MYRSILIMLHCKEDTGYAISSLETTFKNTAISAGFHEESIFWSYSQVSNSDKNTFKLGYYSADDAAYLEELVAQHNITTILAFDLSYPTPITKSAKADGVSHIIAYWGAA